MISEIFHSHLVERLLSKTWENSFIENKRDYYKISFQRLLSYQNNAIMDENDTFSSVQFAKNKFSHSIKILLAEV